VAFYLLITALFIPLNLWAAITPHLHSDLSMRSLHGVSVLLLLPGLVDLLGDLLGSREASQRVAQLVLAIFLVTLAVINTWIVFAGMGVERGWLDHLFLCLAMVALITFYLLRPQESNVWQRIRGQ
jgi:hypothetical protein